MASRSIMGLGVDLAGTLLVKPVPEEEFAQSVLKGLGRNARELDQLTNASTRATTFRAEVERDRAPDLGDPRAVGWTLLMNDSDPRRAEILNALRPLADRRNARNFDHPLPYNGEGPDQWFDWLLQNYTPLDEGSAPHYVLIIGGPDQVPFHFQAFLGSAAAVGRIDFDTIAEFKAYVEKLVRIESAAAPVTKRQALFFATDHGGNDPTVFSRRYMAEPLAAHVKATLGVPVQMLSGEDATKKAFLQAAGQGQPSLVYTASHGLGLPDRPLTEQARLNGALVCQDVPGAPSGSLLTAEDVPESEPFLEGSTFFQFACFGYGTPAQSDYDHWFGESRLNADKDFLAALPKRLLANPRGPIAYVGHVDMAWLHGFDDPADPVLIERWHPRVEPFLRAVNTLLAVQPVGLALGAMSKRYDFGNALLATYMDRLQRGTLKMTPDAHHRLAQTFIVRSDAQNYMLFGDPGASLRIPQA